jgi:hypothetical protein
LSSKVSRTLDGLGSDDDFVSALNAGFIEAQEICAQFGMKPTQAFAKSSWSKPWIHKKTNAKELFKTMENKNVILIIFCLQLMMWDLQTMKRRHSEVQAPHQYWLKASQNFSRLGVVAREEIGGLQSELHIIF